MMKLEMRGEVCRAAFGQLSASRRAISCVGTRPHRLRRHRAFAVPDIGDETHIDFMLDRFKMFDIDNNGQIDKTELRALLESLDSGTTTLLSAQNWLPDEELDQVMQKYDTDGTGSIDFAKFSNIVYDGLLLEGNLSDYEEIFNLVDQSGNGTIGAMELAQLLKAMGADVTFDKLASYMEKFDKDGSGQIEFHEFLHMFWTKLLDLREIKNFLAGKPSDGGQPLLEPQEGDINLIFSQQEFDSVVNRQDDKLVVVFTALTWCRPCKAMQRPAIRMAQHYKDTYAFIKLFGNSNEQTKSLFQDQLKVKTTPCFMILKDGKMLHSHSGTNKENLEDVLRHFVPAGKMPKGRLYFPQM